jgi:hypothetical protein
LVLSLNGKKKGMKFEQFEGDRDSVYQQIFSESETFRETQVLLINLDMTSDPYCCHVNNLEVRDLGEIIEKLKRDRRKLSSSKSLLKAYRGMLKDPEQTCTLLLIETAEAQFFNIHVNQTIQKFIEACDFALASSD